jgi:hypothetical protein
MRLCNIMESKLRKELKHTLRNYKYIQVSIYFIATHRWRRMLLVERQNNPTVILS